jgi:aldose 1-epimerase
LIGQRTVEGFSALTIADGRGELEAAFVPEAGMVGCSLLHRGEELLGMRRGLRAYATEHSTMGIPLLYPWANRLGRTRFPLLGRDVDLEGEGLPLNRDPNGLPIHGLLAGADGWRVERHEASPEGGLLEAAFDFGAGDELLEAFPFPHELRLEAVLDGSRLTISTAVRPTGDRPVPVAFGFHPYLRLPEVKRSRWEVEVPVQERLVLDDRLLPTGEREPVSVEAGPLGSRTFDDAYLAPPNSQPLGLVGGGRRIEVRLESGYPYTQVYAPADDDVVAFEPMTTPTNALVNGEPNLEITQPGHTYRASFSITVGSVGPG